MADADPELTVASYRPFSPSAVIASVRKGEFQNPKWLYATSVTPEIWQGDLLVEVRLAWIGADGAAQGYEGAAIVLSHGCDTEADRDLMATLAPAFVLSDYIAEVSGLANSGDAAAREEAIRLNRVTNNFFLPGVGSSPDRVVDFSWACSVSNRYLEAIASASLNEKLRLTRPGWYLFTAKLAHHVAHEEAWGDYPRA